MIESFEEFGFAVFPVDFANNRIVGNFFEEILVIIIQNRKQLLTLADAQKRKFLLPLVLDVFGILVNYLGSFVVLVRLSRFLIYEVQAATRKVHSINLV